MRRTTGTALCFRLLAALAVSVCTADAHAQRKPDPPTVEPDRLDPPNIDAWAEAYYEWGEPSILVISGWSTLEHQTETPGGTTLFDFDRTGLTMQIRSAFENIINDPRADAYLIDENVARTASRRLQNALANNSKDAAVRLLANDIDAELLITIELLTALPGGVPDRVQFKAVDITSGRTLTNYPFQWKLGSDARSVKTYANAMARKFIDDFYARVKNPRRFSLHLFGIGNDARLPAQVKDAIEGVCFVSGRVRGGSSRSETNPRTGERESMILYRVPYNGGAMDLQADVTEALMALDDVQAQFISTEGTQISLRITRPEPVREQSLEVQTFQGCLDTILLRNENGKAQREVIADLYDKQDSPSVAVLVNRQPTQREREKAVKSGEGISGDTVVLVNTGTDMVDQGGSGELDGDEFSRGQWSVRAISTLERQTNLIESALNKRLGPALLSFDRKDAQTARSQLRSRIDKQRTVFPATSRPLRRLFAPIVRPPCRTQRDRSTGKAQPHTRRTNEPSNRT